MTQLQNRFSFDKPIADTRVVVAMSGGVDSSVVAAMMAEEGYETIGITLQLYDHGQALAKKNACCAGQDIDDAREVCEKLGIAHYVLDYESLFREAVIEEFAESYLRGETPIPCVRCNQSVKFRDLLKVAKELNADALVTGHYIRRVVNDKGVVQLHNAIDASKDQSYFLFATTKEQLDFVHFPLGDFTKEETRQLAEKYGLNVAAKPDSQDICFVPNGDYANIVGKLRPESKLKGHIIDIDSGAIVAEHNGIINYTKGQRKGLGGGFTEPKYVVKIDAKQNIVYIGGEEHLFEDELKIDNINWIGEGELSDYQEIEAEVKLRSLSSRKKARIIPVFDNETSSYKALVKLYEKDRAITKGQACVIYQNEQILGGGWII